MKKKLPSTRITKGPTDPEAIIEFTDWDKVDEFARMIAEM